MKLRHPLALAFLLGACKADPQALYRRAQQEFGSHRYASAQLDLANALAAQPDNFDFLELRARNALAQGNGAGAKSDLARLPLARRPADFPLLMGEAELLDQHPDAAVAAVARDNSAEAARIRAMAALQQGNNGAAETAFAAGLSSPGTKARLRADLARYKLHAGDVDSAVQLIGAALGEAPQSIDAQLVDAQIAVARGDLAGALARYEKVGKEYPESLAPMIGKAEVLGDLGRTKEMEEALAKASAGLGKDPSIAYLKARAAAARRDWKGAREILQSVEGELSGRDDATLLYAQALSELGQYEQARSRLQPVLTRQPGNPAARRLMARIQLTSGDARGAVETLRPFASQATAEAADLRLLAQAAAEAHDPDAARFAARARFPGPQALARLLADADAAMKARNWANAIQLYQQILAVTDGRNALVLNNMAYAQGQVGNGKVGLGYALRALKEAPDNPSVMDTAGWLLATTGTDRTRALQLLRRASEKAPGNSTIRQHLREAEAG